MDELHRTVRLTFGHDMTAETYFDSFVGTTIFPHIAVFEPCVGKLYLLVLENFLFEKTYAVAKTVTVTRDTERCERIKEARRKTTETAVAETCFGVFVQKFFEIDTEIGKTFFTYFADTEIEEIGRHQASHQKFDREVVDLFSVFFFICDIRFEPVTADMVADNTDECLVFFVFTCRFDIACAHRLQFIDKCCFKCFFVFEHLIVPPKFSSSRQGDDLALTEAFCTARYIPALISASYGLRPSLSVSVYSIDACSDTSLRLL